MRVSVGYLRHLAEIAPAAQDRAHFAAVADEIERLRAEVSELRRHTNSCPYSDAEFWCMRAGPGHATDCLYDSEQESGHG